MTTAPARRGAILIVVVGFLVMLAGLATTFLAHARSQAQVGVDAVRLAQNRLMLHAAMSYIQEASRVGYGPTLHTFADGRRGWVEAWGWIDTRVEVPVPGSRIGPNDADGRPLWSPGSWPAPGTHVRGEMYAMQRPPLAVTQELVRNPIAKDLSSPVFGLPFLARPDPVPELPPGTPYDETDPASTPGGWNAWLAGDRAARIGSEDLAWFRIYREDLAMVGGELQATDANPRPDGSEICTFVVTVGAGGTRGFRDFDEALAAGQGGLFGGDRRLFEELAGQERRQWFRVAWSASVGGGEDLQYRPKRGRGYTDWVPSIDRRLGVDAGTARSDHDAGTVNASRTRVRTLGDIHAQSHPRNYVGTIRTIQRLDGPPVNW